MLRRLRRTGSRSQTGDQASRAQILSGFGDVDLRQGRYAEAADHQRQSLAIFQQIRYKSGQATAINGLGEVSLATGNTADAKNQHAAALELSSQTGEKRELARARDGLARACHARGDHHQARRHWDEALALYLVLGAPEAEVQSWPCADSAGLYAGQTGGHE